ncbi:MAG: hypothetical protein Kow0092_06910 [Deferrisomatales bacterium]
MVGTAAVLLTAGAVALGFRAGGGAKPSGAASLPDPGDAVERVLFSVQGVSCGSCEGRIREALARRPGVRAVGVDLAARTVTVEYVKRQADPKALADAVTGLGYPARYLASGASVAPPAAARPGTGSGGCGGSCCSGRPPAAREAPADR